MGRLQVLIGAALAAAALPALAEYTPVDLALLAKDRVFLQLDRNGDAAISRAEAEAHPAIARGFRGADEDGDGRLTPVEFVRIPLNRVDQPGWSRSANLA